MRQNSQPFPAAPVTAGTSVEGRPITYRVLGDGRHPVLILGTIHGNEPAGAPLVRELGACLVRRPDLLDDKQVILLEVANPDGLAKGTRRNALGVDLNRNFPADNFSSAQSHGPKPLSEPETRAIQKMLTTYQPRRLVSIHQPLNCVDFDGPARDLAEAMADSGGLPLRKLGGRAGSLGSYAGITLGIPTVTVELPRSAGKLTDDQLWERYGPMLLTAIWFPARLPEF